MILTPNGCRIVGTLGLEETMIYERTEIDVDLADMTDN